MNPTHFTAVLECDALSQRTTHDSHLSLLTLMAQRGDEVGGIEPVSEPQAPLLPPFILGRVQLSEVITSQCINFTAQGFGLDREQEQQLVG